MNVALDHTLSDDSGTPESTQLSMPFLPVTKPYTPLSMLSRLTWKTMAPSARDGARPSLKRCAIMAVFVPMFVAVQATNWLGLLVDHILFPGFRTVTPRAPLFILGGPRSGTTFLHRLLASDEARFTTTKLWELIFAPSITQRAAVASVGKLDRALGRPMERALNWVQRKVLGSLDDIHATKLQDPEEDYLALTPIGACFLLTLPFPVDEVWQLAWFDDAVPDKERRRVMAFYRGIVQRHLYWHGPDKIYLSKNPSFSPMIRSLSEAFPDGRFIGCFRHPARAVPSLLSSMHEGAALFDNDTSEHRYRDQLLAMLQHYYHHVQTELPELPEDRQVMVTLECMGAAPRQTVHQLYQRFGWTIAAAFDEFLQQQDLRAQRYRSSHTYALEDFDLDAATLESLFAPVYANFGYACQSHE